MAGKKPTQVNPAPPSAQRSGGAASSPKRLPKQASAAGAKASGKNRKEKPAAEKKKRGKAEQGEGLKRKKQQASGEAATPSKKRKKGDGPDAKPQKEATPTEKPSPGKAMKAAAPAATPTKKTSPGKALKAASPAPTPTKKQQKEANREKHGGAGKPTPRKRKDGDSGETPNEARSPKRAADEGKARAPTPVKKNKRNQKAAVADKGACSFPMARVRQLMRAEDATIRASTEAVFLVNKASELFLEKFAEDAYHNALKDRKKSINYDNLAVSVSDQKSLKFLSDFVPQRVTAEDALKAAARGQS